MNLPFTRKGNLDFYCKTAENRRKMPTRIADTDQTGAVSDPDSDPDA